MLKSLRTRLHQGHRTMGYPAKPAPALPERFRGRPKVDAKRCPDGCTECARVCPTDAIVVGGGPVRLDFGKCLFCTECVDACPEGAIEFTSDYRMATRHRADLSVPSGETLRLAQALEKNILRLFGRSLKLRQVSAGGCNGCESDVNVLTTIGWDLGRFGIQFVASPRHADGVLLTGCVTGNMKLALEKTYAAIAPPKIVIAVGACAISGGPFAGQLQQHNGGTEVFPVDLFIPGCPPHPLTILDGLLRLLDRLPHERVVGVRARG